MKKSQAYVMILRSYLIVLFVPILITIFGYFYSNKMIGEEVTQYQSSIIKKTQGIGDQIISNHMLSKGALLSNKQLKNLMNAEEWSGELMFDIVELKNVINGMKNSNYLMEDVQVYFPQSGNLLTTQRRYPKQLTYIYTTQANIEGEYEDIIDFTKARGYFILKPGSEECTIYFYENTFARNYHDVLASIVTVLRWKDVELLLGDMDSNSKGTIFLIDKENRIIGNSNPNVDISNLTYDFFTKTEEPIYTQINGEAYICSYMESEVIDLKYVICIPRREFYQKNNFLLLVIILDLIICIAIGVSLAVYFARKSSNPIERLLSKLGSKRLQENDKQYKMFHHLEDALSDVLTDYEDMEKQLENQNSILYEKMLVSLLNGRKQTNSLMADYASQLHARMKQEWSESGYRLITVGFNNLDNSILDVLSLAYFSLKNVLQETFLNDKWGMLVDIDNVVVCIMGETPELQNQLESFIEFFNQVFQLKVYVAVSQLHFDVEELSVSYDEAMNVVEFKNFWEDEVDDILFYDENKEETIVDPGNYTEDIKKLNNCIIAKEYAAAKEMLCRILEESFQKDIKNMSINKCQASGIIGLILNMISGMEADYAEEVSKKLNLPDRLLNTHSIHQLRAEIELVFDELIACNEEANDGKIPKKILDAKEYIDKNYADVNLSISAIADSFNMSLSYMGRMFKRYTGNGILGYLHMVRIEKCKELLDEGKSVKDAAALSGFIDSKSMIRTFRKYEGITPGQYKKQKM